MHRHPIQAALVWRDLMSDHDVFALKQNNHRKAPSDPVHPLAWNLRKRYRAKAKAAKAAKAGATKAKPKRQENALVIRRVWNLCTNVKRVVKKEINTLVTKAKSIVAEDGANAKTRSKRWTYIFKGLDPSSKICHKFLSAYKSTKKNVGNGTARGLTKTEKKSYNEQMADALALGKGVPFWARPDNATKKAALELPKKDKKRSKHVFDQRTFHGIRRGLYDTKVPIKINQDMPKNQNDGAIKSQNRHLFS